MNNNKSTFKICVLGDGGVGKTALTIQLCSSHFVEQYDPTIEDCYRKATSIDNTPAFLEILDTAGQEEFTALRDQWIRDSEGFVLVYSITDRQGFEQIEAIKESIDRVKEGEVGELFPISVAGNKADLEDARVVRREEGERLAGRVGGAFFETSAKEKTNLEECFFHVVREIRKMDEKRMKGKGGKEKEGLKKRRKNCAIL